MVDIDVLIEFRVRGMIDFENEVQYLKKKFSERVRQSVKRRSHYHDVIKNNEKGKKLAFDRDVRAT